MAKLPFVPPDGADYSNQPKTKKRKRTTKARESESEVLPAPNPQTESTETSADSKSALYAPCSELTALAQSVIDSYLTSHSIRIVDPSDEPIPRPITSFAYLPPAPEGLYHNLKGFSEPTPIQSASWPLAFSGRDVIGVAETGSGKTLAFGLPCLRRVSALNLSRKSRRISAVIITPTRELAIQIHEQLVKYSPSGIGITCIYGGVSKDQQRKELRTASIIVATPGRLKDLQNEQSVDLHKVKYLVLDEADRMLDKGFEQDIRDIVSAMPSTKKRQTIMFTATWPQSVRDLSASFLKQPVTVSIGDRDSSDLRANTRIKQIVEVIKPEEKEYRLWELLRKHQGGKKNDERVLVFCLYKKEATRIERFIRSKGFRVAGIHGDLNQTQRCQSLDAFKEASVNVLVATDVAARGLDIPSVKVVINCTFPLTVEDYVHRIGRTGRAGATGLAVTLFTDHDKALSGPLINVLRAAEQEVPEALMKFGATVKRKQHDSYGAFFRDMDNTKAPSKIKFSD